MSSVFYNTNKCQSIHVCRFNLYLARSSASQKDGGPELSQLNGSLVKMLTNRHTDRTNSIALTADAAGKSSLREV